MIFKVPPNSNRSLTLSGGSHVSHREKGGGGRAKGCDLPQPLHNHLAPDTTQRSLTAWSCLYKGMFAEEPGNSL